MNQNYENDVMFMCALHNAKTDSSIILLCLLASFPLPLLLFTSFLLIALVVIFTSFVPRPKKECGRPWNETDHMCSCSA